MTRSTPSFQAPPRSRTRDGALRRVGFEMEFTGLTLERTTEIVERVTAGAADVVSEVESAVRSEGLGSFQVELDWAWLKQRAAEAHVAGEGSEWVSFLRQAVEWVVPMEIVCPPIALDDLGVLDELVAALRAAGGRGTEDSPLAAYGVHVNAEAASLDAAEVLDTVRAFGLLQWWLVERHEVDISRRISPYIDLYPEAYVLHLATDGARSEDALFDAYLEHNPTRNRGLDLLPLLAEIDETRVRRQIDDPRIKARPAYHYRLPDCLLERAGWSLADAWNTWVVVERLAADRTELDALSSAFEAAHRPLLGVSRGRWVETLEDRLCRLGWA